MKPIYLKVVLAFFLTLATTSLYAQTAYYMRGDSPPWGGWVLPQNQGSNEDAMTRVFNNNWATALYSTANPNIIFDASTKFVFLEGSDGSAFALNSFLTANRTKIEQWVSNGGRLFLNAAPNQGGNINFGFGGVTLQYPAYTSQAFAANTNHVIFNSPNVPVGTGWSGGAFGHGVVSGTGLTALIINSNSGQIVLSEKNIGSGKVLFGGMTLPFFHSPKSQVYNLRANIIHYTANSAVACVSPLLSVSNIAAVSNEFDKCGAPVSFSASSTGTAPISIKYSIIVEGSSIEITSPYFFPVGSTNVTATAINACGNDSKTFTVTVTDNVKPVITTNGDKSVNNDAGACSAAVTVSASATDNCSVGTPTGVRSDALALTAPYPVGTTTIKWNVTDINGNPATEVVQTITVTDTQFPGISTNGDQNLNAEAGFCEASFMATASATDNCYVAEPTGIRSDGKALTEAYPVGITTITWNVTDINGNPATEVVQTITVTDTQAPVISTNGDQNLNAEAGLCEASFMATTSATDNCSVGNPTGARSDNLALTEAYPVGITTITWNVTDINGNPATEVIQTITVTDTQVPVISTNGDQNLNAETGLCEASFTATASATDNCSVAAPTGIRSDSKVLTEAYPVGETTITWNVTDVNGNPATQVIQTITVIDTQAPVISTNGNQNLNAEAGLCEASFTATATATDNCSVAEPTGIRNDGKTLTEAYPVGETTITWNVTDINGNPATEVIQTITVIDTQGPVISTNGDQNMNAETGLCEASFTATATATDNCSVVAPTGIRSDGKALTEAYPVGETTITWNVTDINGNPASPVIQTIAVTDTQVPVISTNGNQNLNAETGLCAASVTVSASATDNCSVGNPTGVRSDGKALTEAYPVGETTIIWNVTDINGNPANEVIQTITVTDTQVPIWQTAFGELDRIVFCGQDQLFASAQNLQPIAFDNCSLGSIQKTTGVFVPTGPNGAGTFTNTWIAEDLVGNKSEVYNQVITIQGIEIDASASGTPVQVGSTATLSATVTPNVAGVTVNFYLDGLLKGSSLTNTSGIATLGVPGLQLNVYKVTAEVGNGCSESIAYLPVYDPNGSFVTGGGWINSPAGAYSEDPSLVGKASFGFVSKYKKGSNEVDGNTEFQFNAGNLNFKSTLHEAGALVISGKKATYRGDGTINGIPGFRFTITAIDGNWNGGSLPDQFRIKIWGGNGVIYDNGLGADDNSEVATTLGGGSIVIHQANAKGTKRVSAELITVDWNTPVETIRQKVDLMSGTWFDSRKLALTLDASTYDPLTPGFYELKADLVENEFFELDEPIAIQVLVQDKPKALDIELSDHVVAKDVASGTVIGTLSTIDPADDIHTYSMDAHSDLDIQGNQLIWKGTNIPAAQMKVTVFSTDRAGQTISKEIKLSRELKPGEFFLYPNPAVNETNVMLDLDQSATVGFQVYDAIGRLVIQDEAYKEGSFTHTLKLDGLAPGMYTVQLKVGNMVMTKRLIKN